MAPDPDRVEDEVPTTRDLPAPYVSPWSEAGRTFLALVADCRLRAQELWRRNREGSLSVPAFWPRDLAPSFWPLVIVLPLIVLVGVVVLLTATPNELAPLPATSTEVPVVETTVVENPMVEPTMSEPAAPEPDPMPEPDPVPPENPVVPFEPAAAVAPPDPLLTLLQKNQEDSGLLLGVEPVADDDLIRLRLAKERWAVIDSDQRERVAERWQNRLLEAGFDRLELVDDSDQLLGRSALVGSGMILLNADDSSGS